MQIDVIWFPEGAGGDRYYLRETVIKHPDRAEATRVWNFRYAAIEEALVNAVYHRSYEEREPIEVRISNDELVVVSFPGPDRSIRLEDLQAGRAVSRRYRNRDRRIPEGAGPDGMPLDGHPQNPQGDGRQRLACTTL